MQMSSNNEYLFSISVFEYLRKTQLFVIQPMLHIAYFFQSFQGLPEKHQNTHKKDIISFQEIPNQADVTQLFQKNCSFTILHN